MHRLLRGRAVHRSPFTVHRSAGFTLIELLVVISIIAILSLVVVTNLTSARTKARDAKRTSDIQSIGQALALYATTGEDTTNAVKIDTAGPWGVAAFDALVASPGGPLVSSGSKYLPTTSVVKDPLNNAPYQYEFKNSTPTPTPGNFSNFALCAKLENAVNGNLWYVDVDGSTSMQASDAACN